MTNKLLDVICSAIFLIFGGLMLFFSLRIRHTIPSDVGSGYVPIFLASCIIITAAVKLILTLLDKKAAKAVKKGDGDWFGGIGTVGLMLAYVLAFESVGFLISSIIYLFAQIMLMSNKQNRRPILFAVISIVLPFAVSLLFAYAIKMPLPVGIFGF